MKLLNCRKILFIAFWLLAAAPSAAYAYIGPGAGFAFLSSFLFIFAAIAVAVLSILTLPVRILIRKLKSRKAYTEAKTGRIVIVGLDGMDPELAKRYMKEGKLPHFSKLSREGFFSPLRTTNPPISPVAWSSFITGVNPGKHNIFDFLRRDPKTYLPSLSSAEIGTSRRKLSIGKLSIPFGKPQIRMLRKSVPFWKILSDHGISSTVLKVPITFPPEKFGGFLLSGLCTPDIKGSQGTFAFYTDRDSGSQSYTGGYAVRLEGGGPLYETTVSGPQNPIREKTELRVPLRIYADRKAGTADLEVDGTALKLKEGELSDWVHISFTAGPGIKIRGIAHFFLKSLSPHLELYLSPINIDPAKPALPVSYPLIYSIYLSKTMGPFATLGLPQDTWALNEGALTDDAFLEQTYRVHDRLEEIFFHSLERTKKGMVACVFDTTDVIQHEFWRYTEKDHPALKDGGNPKPLAIEELYRRMDGMMGRVLERLQPDDVLFVLSDHGFKLFRRGVNLNSWLEKNGYLKLKDSSKAGDWFEGVDWDKTRAYAFGLAGLYINTRGRERNGIVGREEAEELKQELSEKLTGLKDDESDEVAISAVYDSTSAYSGPYKNNSPDLIVGYRPGYRTSWESVTGRVTGSVFSDNKKAWSADHCMDHRFVPGVLFCNRGMDETNPGIEDLAPTVLELFGIRVPGYMDGKPFSLKQQGN